MASENTTLTDSEVKSPPVKVEADNEILDENTENVGGSSASNEKADDEKVKEKKETKKKGRGKKEQIKDEVGETTKQDNAGN